MIAAVALLQLVFGAGMVRASTELVRVPGGEYEPFFAAEGKGSGARATVRVPAYRMDRAAVTNSEFRDFVRKNPEWRRSRVPRLFADPHYLAAWKGDLRPGPHAAPRAPVVSVSWFAAQAYCESRGLSLPTVDQWEFALRDDGRKQQEVRDESLAWFGKPNPRRMPDAGQGHPNGFGIQGLIGVVWEWTLDFNGIMTTDESRSPKGATSSLFCGGGAGSARSAEDYPAFMRFSYRSSLKASHTTENLGFRCATGEAE